ncbi:GNAT family N-acetyltransferase [Nocardioides mangrovi]|uniref:Lysine N-acyltransferase MbtK n=1 Tax=Nocardioides mangrovi TaxID=2874580 RepID=A0ABS7U800_9ACTN|nr:GNAT family N-acetyltransferase [Nocardioides mangrovi]MBZ5737119.1 GNAT family N-acetyltransferase [Nocardioides mangrovi]
MRPTLEPLDLTEHLPLVHAWVTHPRSVYWQMQDATLADVEREYRLIEDDPHHHAWLGRVDGTPAFLAETYDPAHSELAGLPELRPGDLGMHVLVAPTERPVHGFTRAVFGAVLDHCLADPAVRRVVVEPDARNHRIRALNREFGFRELRTITLPTKEATLSVRTRSDQQSHLTPDVLAAAQRHLVTKAISELAHERVLAPVADGDRWLLTTPAGDTTYSFAAERLALDHWAVDPATVVRTVKDEPAELDAQDFVVEFSELLGVPDALLPTYLEELAATLQSACWKLAHSTLTVDDLLRADHQTIEGAMTEGHPGFIANNGRVGFGADDYAAYAPETGSDVRLHWLAARRTLSHHSGPVQYDESLLVDAGLDPADYHLVPVHPWQWTNKLAITFAPDVARGDLVHLGEGPDRHRPQQSIRTFANASRPEQPYVKTALSIQNMGFMRGLSPTYMEATPTINEWVHELVVADPTLRACGFSVLREIASVGYTGDAFHRLDLPSPYRKMIAGLWRESPVSRVGDGERLMTMAALLHRDASGRSLAAAMIEASPYDAATWLRSYLDAYVRPIVHCLLAHDLAFMPHGENLVLVVRDQVPVRAIMKDIGEEIAVMSTGRPLPAEVERVRVDVEQEIKALALHTDVFDGVLRHLAAILHTDGVLDEEVFWSEVTDCVRRHQEDHPELADAAAAYDLFRPTFRHSCLNRLQLRNTLEMVDISDQAESLIYAGTLDNPMA